MAAARAVVGWYGDPTVSWSVLLQARLATPAQASAVAERLGRLVTRYPHLGAAPVVLESTAAEWPVAHAAFADEPYLDGEPLVRAAVATDDGLLLVAAHHGATDGLGLLAVLAAALGTDLVSQARGIADRPATAPFLASAARRLAEALFAPPARIAPSAGAKAARSTGPVMADAGVADAGAGGAGRGDVLVAVELPATSAGSAAVTAATARAAQEWNARHGTPFRRAVAGLGVSRRDGVHASPVPDSAFLRLRLPRPAGDDADDAAVRRLIAGQAPEPAFPRSRSAAPAAVTRILASRLGSTFLASNLGVVRGDPGVRSLAFYPSASGRSGVAVGAATIAATTTITLRARRSAFDHPAAADLLSMIVTHLAPPR